MPKLTGESRIDALVLHLKEKHGFSFPEEISPAESEEVEEPSEPKEE